MRKLFLALVIIPFISSSQCPNLIGKGVNSVKPLIETVETFIAFKLRVKEIPDDYNLLRFEDSLGFSSIIIALEPKKPVTGSIAVDMERIVKSIYIDGPADRIDNLVKAYFEPMIKPCIITKTSICYFWDRFKLTYFDQGTFKGIPMKYIEIARSYSLP